MYPCPLPAEQKALGKCFSNFRRYLRFQSSEDAISGLQMYPLKLHARSQNFSGKAPGRTNVTILEDIRSFRL